MRSHQNNQALVKRQLKSAIEQSAQISQLHSEVRRATNLIASVTITEKSDYGIQFEGTNMQAILLPLLTIEPHLAKAFSTLAGEGRMKISAAELTWLEDELENLIGAACASRRQKKSSLSPELKPQGPISFPTVDCVVQDPIQVESRQKESAAGQRRLLKTTDFYTVTTPIGTIAISFHHQIADRSARKCDQQTMIRFAFAPSRTSAHVPAIQAMFLKHIHTPHITRHLRVWNIVADFRNTNQLIVSGNISGLRAGLTQGTISIYDCSEHGASMLAVKSP